MGELTHKAARAAFGGAIDFAMRKMDKDREKGLLDIVDLTERFMGDNFQKSAYEGARKLIQDPDSKWMRYLNRALDEIEPHVVKQTALNLGFEAAFHGTKMIRSMREVHQCNIPWLILMDPTSACNLHCTGCWAAEYGNRLNLSFDEIDSIITQGKKLGVYMYIYTGGEPLMRKQDLIALCNKHSDCEFLAFTNATLIDEEFADEMLRVKNFIPAISVEGSEEDTDSRRGKGSYQRVVRAMEILRRKKLPFGVSCCYTSQNLDSISSEEFIDQLVSWGAKFAWFFHYMPVGNDAVTQLLPSPQQREQMYHRIRQYRSTKPIFTIDFQNDGEYVGGCIAGGRNYLHINPNGDIEPCVFIHYSDSNIREKTLLEALTSPLFMAYHDGQPFNQNHLRPCPMLENPEKLQEMVRRTGAHSTDLQSPESAEHLCGKCLEYAQNWTETADRLWQCSHCCENCKK